MTMSEARELVDASRILSRANAFFLARLARIVDVTRLTEGDAEDDYYVDVPSSRLAEIGWEVSDVKITTEERFNAHLSMFPVPFDSNDPAATAAANAVESKAAV